MPSVGSRLGHDVNHRAGITAIFHPKVAGGHLVLLHPVRVAEKNPRAGNGVVVVVLTIDLLVVVPSTDPIRAEANAILIGIIIVARSVYSGEEDGKIIQTLILANRGKLGNGRAGQGVRNLGLRGV